MNQHQKKYRMAIERQSMDSPLVLRSDEIIIKKDRFESLVAMENMYILLKLEYKSLKLKYETTK